MVTFDPLALLDKLGIIHAPLLLPWVMACCTSASGPRWIFLELGVLVMFQLASEYVMMSW